MLSTKNDTSHVTVINEKTKVYAINMMIVTLFISSFK